MRRFAKPSARHGPSTKIRKQPSQCPRLEGRHPSQTQVSISSQTHGPSLAQGVRSTRPCQSYLRPFACLVAYHSEPAVITDDIHGPQTQTGSWNPNHTPHQGIVGVNCAGHRDTRRYRRTFTVLDESLGSRPDERPASVVPMPRSLPNNKLFAGELRPDAATHTATSLYAALGSSLLSTLSTPLRQLNSSDFCYIMRVKGLDEQDQRPIVTHLYGTVEAVNAPLAASRSGPPCSSSPRHAHNFRTNSASRWLHHYDSPSASTTS